MKIITVTIEDRGDDCDPTSCTVTHEFTDNANFSHMILPFINALRGDGMEITHDEVDLLRNFCRDNLDWTTETPPETY